MPEAALRTPVRCSRVCVILTARNRRSLTLRAVRAVLDEASESGVDVSVVLVDDGSSDGTGDAAADLDPQRVTILTGPGDLFWAAGMALAEQGARRQRPDYLLWLNDDVDLFRGFLHTMIDTSSRHGGAVVVGATRDPDHAVTTYSGMVRSPRHPLAFSLVEPDQERPVDAFNGNVVLVPRRVSEQLGGIDGQFAHAYADIDYGLRLRQQGIQAVLAAGYVGSCRRNPPAGSWTDRRLPVRARFRLLHGAKGAPPVSSARFLRRHGGRAWPVFLVTPYARIVGEAALRPFSRGFR